jgi:hypothetical protein
MSVQYSIPDYVRVSADCKHLLSRIFVANPAKVVPIHDLCYVIFLSTFSLYLLFDLSPFIIQSQSELKASK